MTNKCKFEIGEWAVLRHDQGGRLFLVGDIKPEGGHFRIAEQDEQDRRFWFDVWDRSLVKVADKAAAERLVSVLDYIDYKRKIEIGILEQRYQAEFNSVISKLELMA